MSENRKAPERWAPEPDGFGNHAVQEPSLSNSEPNRDQVELDAELDSARQHLDQRVEAMAVISAWRTELRAKIARARLCFELVGITDEEHAALRDEVEKFRRTCTLLRWLGKTRT
jgi:hypothetical protein